jgi:ABC-type branched-subunit amino acid transport system substrate-binding protein
MEAYGEVAMKLSQVLALTAAAGFALAGSAHAEKAYDTGATDTEIKIGITAPLSGPASSYGIACQAHDAYFKKINEAGGINGRKLVLLCEDDGFTPPRAVERTRKLVESDGVLFMYNSLGTSVNTAVQPYLAGKHVPQLLLNSGASKWSDPAKNPWSTSSIPHYVSEAVIFAHHIMSNNPNAKVGLLRQADDFGKDYENGLKKGFGDKASQYLKSIQTFEISDPTVDSQVLQLRGAGVDVVVLGALAKGAAQAIRKVGELGWKPRIYLGWSSTGINTVLTPAGLENAKNIISTAVIKHPDDPAWKDDKDVAEYRKFMNSYFPSGDVANISNVFAYATDEVLVDVLTRAGDNLTRENIRTLAQNIDVQPRMYINGIRFKTNPQDLDPIKTFQMIKFDGESWVSFGDPISPQ